MKSRKSVNFLIVTLFSGVVLTFMIYIGLGTVFGSRLGNDGNKSFNEMFYGDKNIISVSRHVGYRLFGSVEGKNIIIGEDDWLFETVDSGNGYQRLLDYIGGNPFTEEELDAVSENLKYRTEIYERAGIEYMIIVVPDSMTVASDKVPWYLGKRSEKARLSQLSAYLSGEETDALIDMTDVMLAESNGYATYNNTENSINAYGAYCIYNAVISRYLDRTGQAVDRIHRTDIDFYTRLTDGRRIAQSAGLEDTVRNRTVSLSDSMEDNYTLTYNEKGFVLTERTDGLEGTCVVIECRDDWDRIQLTPYFSNTFDKVYYRNELASEPDSAAQYGADLVVQIIHESELDVLLK